MNGRLEMLGSSNGRGKKMATDAEVVEKLAMFGKPRLLPAPSFRKGRQDRRSDVQGGGESFVAPVVRKHPFLVGFGGTLIALRTIHGDRVAGT